MNRPLENQKYNKKDKTIRKASENEMLKYRKIEHINKSDLIQRKKTKIIIPPSISNEKQNLNYFPTFNSNISFTTSRKFNSKGKINDTVNNIYESVLSNNNIKEKLLIQKPKIKIKMHSLKHNNIYQNITPDRNSKKYKVNEHNDKTEIIQSSDRNYLKMSDFKNIKNIKKQTNYSIFNLNNDNINIYNENTSNSCKKSKEKELSLANYYNIMQKKSLKILSNNLDNLIVNRLESKLDNPEFNRGNELNYRNNNTNILENIESEKVIYSQNKGCNTNVYRKKIQRKKNYYLNSNSELNNPVLEAKIKLQNMNKSQIINKFFQNNLPNNKLMTKREQKYIYKRNNCRKEDSLQAQLSNESRSITYNNLNTSILINPYIIRKNANLNNNINDIKDINRNYMSEARPKKGYINTDNINNLIINNKENTINFIEVIKPEYRKEENILLNKNYSDIRYKKKYNYNTPKVKNNNNMTTQLEDRGATQEYENTFNFNYFINTNDNKINLTNKCVTLYSNMSSQYNTVNTLNNSDKNILKANNMNLNFKENNNIDMNIKTNKKIKIPVLGNYNYQKKIYIKNDFNKRKNTNSNNSKNKKLRNVITSIEYKNRNNRTNKSNEKNLILSEVDQNGKINIRVREMKNSIEKIIRENSMNKSNTKSNNSYFDFPSPKNWNKDITYVKKNQGTHIKKIRKHHTVNHLNCYYPPPIPFQ